MSIQPPVATSEHDIALIGAGPIGIELAVAFRRAGLDYVHIEAGCIGSTIAWWAPGTRFFSSPERIAISGVPLVVAGQEKASREEYLGYLRGVVEQFDLPIRQFERVTGATRHAGGFELQTRRSSHGVGGPLEGQHDSAPLRTPPSRIRAKRIVLAIGNMHRPRLLNVPGEELSHVSHYLADPHLYTRRRVVIVGGRNSAVEAAIRLYRVGANVTLIHRRIELARDRIKYWLLPELEWLIAQRRINWRPATVVERIDTASVTLRADGGKAAAESVEADAVLLLTGYVQSPELFDLLGIARIGPDARPEINEATMESNVPGVYVAGTATGGSQAKVTVFIENAHEHVARIIRSLTGRSVPSESSTVWQGMEES